MRFAALALSILCAAACQQQNPSAQTPPAQAPSAHAEQAAAAPVLGVEGYGDVHIGMTLEQVRTASGQPLLISAENDPAGCIEQQFDVANGEKIFLMFEENRLVRVTATELSAHVRTAQNVGPGSTDAEVRAAYPHAAQEPAKYSGPPAHDLVVWTTPNQSGIRFEIGADGRVASVHAGGPAIEYMEGCS